MEKLELLKAYWGYSSFKGAQQQVIDNITAKRDVLCVMPTGAGKSVCYQVPALMLEGVTIVISPLISGSIIKVGVRKRAYKINYKKIKKVEHIFPKSVKMELFKKPERRNKYA
ncbi:MAG: DEAD/DEAH box helicase, partial [Acutalibacteraceae bacterium]|nr:DEAD/DEAH box helicase [Acutalibacteraceae bacterium]